MPVPVPDGEGAWLSPGPAPWTAPTDPPAPRAHTVGRPMTSISAPLAQSEFCSHMGSPWSGLLAGPVTGLLGRIWGDANPMSPRGRGDGEASWRPPEGALPPRSQLWARQTHHLLPGAPACSSPTSGSPVTRGAIASPTAVLRLQASHLTPPPPPDLQAHQRASGPPCAPAHVPASTRWRGAPPNVTSLVPAAGKLRPLLPSLRCAPQGAAMRGGGRAGDHGNPASGARFPGAGS